MTRPGAATRPIKEVILIAHAGCGYYRRRMADKPPADVEVAQVRDLHVAARLLERTHPGIVTHVFYAKLVDDHVQFDRLAVPTATPGRR